MIHEAAFDWLLDRLAGPEGTLPENWRMGDDPFFRLRACEIGDLRFLTGNLSAEGLRCLCPALFIRPIDRQHITENYTSGVLVHLRWYDAADVTRNQCRDTADPAVLLSPVRTQIHFAKALNAALKQAPAEAYHVIYRLKGELPELSAPSGPVAVALDFTVKHLDGRLPA